MSPTDFRTSDTRGYNQLAAAVAGLRDKAGQAHDDEMLVGLMQITALVGDCHTRVNMPSPFISIRSAWRKSKGATAHQG